MSVFEVPPQSAPADQQYEQDFYSWALRQAALLRAGRFAELDIANIAEELDTLGRAEFNSLVSALRVLMLHLLKWDQQPEKRSRSWVVSIVVQRGELAEVLTDNPGLKPRLGEALERAYGRARREAAAETGLDIKTFPQTCPYDLAAITAREIVLP
jgi:predicted DNA-binding ribbon-helix-helix protein